MVTPPRVAPESVSYTIPINVPYKTIPSLDDDEDVSDELELRLELEKLELLESLSPESSDPPPQPLIIKMSKENNANHFFTTDPCKIYLSLIVKYSYLTKGLM